MSIEFAYKLIDKLKEDKVFLDKLLDCSDAKERTSFIISEGYDFSINEVIKEVKSGDRYRKDKEDKSDNWKWMDIVIFWCLDRRKGWRRDILDRTARSFLNTKCVKIKCPNCLQQYYVTNHYYHKELECEACHKVFVITPSNSTVCEDLLHKPEEIKPTPTKIPKDNTWKNWK